MKKLFLIIATVLFFNSINILAADVFVVILEKQQKKRQRGFDLAGWMTTKNKIDADLTVLMDETMLGRVLTRLNHNAIKFTVTGDVTLSAKKANGNSPSSDKGVEGEWVMVSVSDTGKGIVPDELPRIFERFYKTDLARNRRESGTGLGLAIAKHIVEAHGGHIWAESQYGAGATFYFTLPTEEEP